MVDDGEGLDTATARGMAESLITLFDTARHRIATTEHSELASLVTEHLGCAIPDIPNVSTRFEAWEHVNLDRGVQAYLGAHSPDAEWFGVAGAMHGMQDLMDMLSAALHHGAFRRGAVDYATAATGPDEAVDVVQFGLVRTVSPGGTPVVLAIRGPLEHSPEPGCALRVLAADRTTATEVRGVVEQLVREHDVFAGKLLQLDVTEHRSNQLTSFLPRPCLDAADVVLPVGVLEAIEQHVVRTAERGARLAAHGQHLKRGVLLYGPPGSGKTHTVRYLMGQLTGATVTVLSGRALMKLLPVAVSLARRLQPSVVVVEDVDLIAEDRSFSHGATPVLFELLNRIDGVDADADVTFILTTNRVEVVERALVERPGRVDLAVEIPKPDAIGRERLLRLYAADTDLDLPDATAVTSATEGVTASFMRELVRRAVSDRLEHTPDGQRVRLDQPTLTRALDDLLDSQHALTRSLLGGGPQPAQ